jgi:segregation and condensation protein B
MLYGTTRQFLLHFGLKDLEELPKIEEFAEVLGEEVDIPGLKRAIEAPRPVEVPLDENEGEAPITLFEEGEEGAAGSGTPDSAEDPLEDEPDDDDRDEP